MTNSEVKRMNAILTRKIRKHEKYLKLLTKNEELIQKSIEVLKKVKETESRTLHVTPFTVTYHV